MRMPENGKSANFLGSFRYHKFVNFLGMSVRKSQFRKFSQLIGGPQTRKFLQNIAHCTSLFQSQTQNSPKTKSRLFKRFSIFFTLYAIFVRRKVSICGLVEVLSSQKNAWVQKSQIHKLQTRKSQKRLGLQIANPQRRLHFSEGPQINISFKFADLRTCDLRNLFADRPPLVYSNYVTEPV
jgi:hypothetical protein